MANAIYPLWKDAMMKKTADAKDLSNVAVNVKVALVNITGGTDHYTYDAGHQYLADVVCDVNVPSPNLSTKAVSAGAFNSDDPTWSSVPSSIAVGALIMYVDTGVAATSPLIAYIDSDVTGTPGLPFTPNGGAATVTVDAGGWFTL